MAGCQGCQERYVGCHSQCEHYKKFRKEIDENKRNKLAHKEYWGYSSKVVERRLKEKERMK